MAESQEARARRDILILRIDIVFEFSDRGSLECLSGYAGAQVVLTVVGGTES